MAAPWRDAIVVGSIVLSAGTYLFDFGSNIVVLMEYSTRFKTLMHLEKEGISRCNAVYRHQTSELSGYFYALVAILACCHSLNAILFKLKFTHSEAPLFAAYFLPLIHLYRLLQLLWHTLSCKGIQDIRSPEMNGLYCILGSAMEGVPMLILQFCGYLELTRDGVFVHSMPTTFKVSVAASLISAAYNGGTSVQSIAKNATTLKQKLCAGAIGASFTLSATLVRCLTFTNVMHIRQYFSQRRTEREQAKFHVSDSIPLLILAGSILAYSLYFWLLHLPRDFSKSLRNPHRLLTALAFSYMTMHLGPLYPSISQANDSNQLGSYIFRLKLLVVSLLHLSLDLAVLCVTHMLGTLPKLYLIVSSVAAVGYMLFLIAYMKFDALCGPVTSSNVSVIPAIHGDDDIDDHKLIRDAVAHHVNPSSRNTNVVRSEKAETMDCPLEGAFQHIRAHPHDVDLLEAKDNRPLMSSSRSLDRAMEIAMKRDRPSIAAWSSLDRYSRAYSEWKKTRGHPLNF